MDPATPPDRASAPGQPSPLSKYRFPPKGLRRARVGRRRAAGTTLMAARWVLLLLVALGTVLRPVLILACDQHALAHAHGSQPHQHVHDAGDVADEEGTHGDHQQSQSSAPAGAADVPPRLAFVPACMAPSRLPDLISACPAPRAPGVPFRPPIA